MQECGKILGEILEQVASLAVPGATTSDLEREAERLFEEAGVKPSFKGYHGYPAILCTSTNHEVVHTIPSDDRPFQAGDIISIDAGATLDGLITDSAIAVIVGGKDAATPAARKFVQTCIDALWAGIHQVKPGARFGDISHAIGKTTTDGGYNIIPELTGHGVGHTLHEDPIIPNDAPAGSGAILEPGMTFALEPIMTMGKPKIRTLADGWNIITKDGRLACQHEHTVLVTETGVEVLTLRPSENLQ